MAEEVTREAIENAGIALAMTQCRLSADQAKTIWGRWDEDVKNSYRRDAEIILLAASQSRPTKEADAELRARIKTVENSAKINGSVAKQRGEEIKRLQDLLASAPAPAQTEE